MLHLLFGLVWIWFPRSLTPPLDCSFWLPWPPAAIPVLGCMLEGEPAGTCEVARTHLCQAPALATGLMVSPYSQQILTRHLRQSRLSAKCCRCCWEQQHNSCHHRRETHKATGCTMNDGVPSNTRRCLLCPIGWSAGPPASIGAQLRMTSTRPTVREVMYVIF